MGTDCTLPIDDGFINLRVGAIIIRGDRVLMVGDEHSSYCYSVGGRIRFGESAEEAVIREVEEETGTRMEIDRLGFIHENFFYGDYSKTRDRLIYEIAYFFYMKVPDAFEPRCESETEYGEREHLIWLPFDSDMTFYPRFFATELKNPVPYVRHLVTDGRKKEEQ